MIPAPGGSITIGMSAAALSAFQWVLAGTSVDFAKDEAEVETFAGIHRMWRDFDHIQPGIGGRFEFPDGSPSVIEVTALGEVIWHLSAL